MRNKLPAARTVTRAEYFAFVLRMEKGYSVASNDVTGHNIAVMQTIMDHRVIAQAIYQAPHGGGRITPRYEIIA